MSRIDQLKSLLEDDPKDAELHYMLALEHATLEDYDPVEVELIEERPCAILGIFDVDSHERHDRAELPVSGSQQRRVPLLPWFFPLDRVGNWNRIYGRRGFLQYQCVLPTGGEDGLRELLERIAHSPYGSFLAVLKGFGDGNANLLSFPRGGFTLALDFARTPGIEAFLDELDDVVLRYGGRLYLAKDARMPVDLFRSGYPAWREFVEVRKAWGADRMLHSMMSRRLEI